METDATRQQTRSLTEAEQMLVSNVKRMGQDLIDLLPSNGREFAIARTKIEEAVMWAVKGITAPPR